MQTTAGPPIPLRGINYYRSPVRVAVLMFFADVAYLWWWLWQFFQFTKREGFPRARSFWWLLVPFYGLYVLYQQLDDLKKAIGATSSRTVKRSMPVIAAQIVALFLGMAAVIVVNRHFLGDSGIINGVGPLATGLGVAYLVRRNRQARQATVNPALLVALISIGAVSVVPTLNPLFLIAWVLLLDNLDS